MKRRLLLLLTVTAMVGGCFTACGNSATVNEPEQKTEVQEESQKSEAKDEVGNPYLGTWAITSVEIDGAKLSVKEAESMGYDYYDDYFIIFKEEGKAVVLQNGYSDIVDWSENNGWLKIDNDAAEYQDGVISLEYYGDKVFMERISDSQDLSEVMEMTGENEREITLEATNDYVEVSNFDLSQLALSDGELSGDLSYTIHITQNYIDTYSDYENIEIYLSFYDENGNILGDSYVYSYPEYEREYTAEDSDSVLLWCDKEAAEVRIDKIVISK